MSSFAFDKGDFCAISCHSHIQLCLERELLRKRYVANLETRTPEQKVEEEALFIELKRLEQNERRFKKDRDELLRTLAGMESGLPDVNADEDGFSATAPAEVKRSKKKGTSSADVETPVSASASSSTIALGHPAPKKHTAKSAAYGPYLVSVQYVFTSVYVLLLQIYSIAFIAQKFRKPP